nr:uncharacterized protein LOC127329275 [Lolium perenne]
MESVEDAAQPEPVNPADVELTSTPKAAAPTATELVDRCSAAAPCSSAAAPSAAVPGSLSAAPSASACRAAPPQDELAAAASRVSRRPIRGSESEWGCAEMGSERRGGGERNGPTAGPDRQRRG